MNTKSKYLELLEKSNITPNFYCSNEYFHKAKLHEEESEIAPILFVLDKDWAVFPPINIETLQLSETVLFGQRIWSDFLEWKPINTNWKSEFLDLEYIYNSKDFLKMEGGGWSVFRKNCRKWSRRFGDGNLTYDWVHMYHHFDNLTELLSSWLEKKGEEKIEDDEVMESYVFEGKNRKMLWDRKGRIYGLNIWDSNYRYVNYRFAICRPEEFLSEYLRFLFYTDPLILNSGKLVNDGGILGNPKLKFFKDKLCPLSVRSVFSWIF